MQVHDIVARLAAAALSAEPMAAGDKIEPLAGHGLKVMSMGFLNPTDKPLVWRGPMLHSVIQQFLHGVE